MTDLRPISEVLEKVKAKLADIESRIPSGNDRIALHQEIITIEHMIHRLKEEETRRSD